MAVACVVLFATLLAGSLGNIIETPENVLVAEQVVPRDDLAADDEVPFRKDYSFSNQSNGWLKFHRIPSTWDEAKHRCHAEGAVLASPLNADLQAAILRLVYSSPVDSIYTGVNAIYSSGDFSSVEGIPLSRLPITWTTGEPRGIAKKCLSLKTRGGTVTNVDCNDRLPYVCYKPHALLTVSGCGTTDSAYNLNSRTGSCYKFHTRGLNWFKAFMTCEAEGGHLAIINSDEEAQILRDLYALFAQGAIEALYPNQCHIGFRDLRDGGSWLTIHGDTLGEAGYSWWDDNQPDNSTEYSEEREACGGMFRNGRLNDIWCGLVSPFICEKSPTSLTTPVLVTK